MKLLRLCLVAALLVGMVGMGAGAKDGFEDGDFTDNPTWSTVESDSLSVAQNQVFDGSFSFEATAAGNGDNGRNAIRNFNINSSDVSNGDNVTVYVRSSSLGAADFQMRFQLSGSSSFASNPFFEMYENNGNIKYGGNDITNADLYASASSSTWYKYVIQLVDDSTVSFYIFDGNNNLLGSAKGKSKSNAHSVEYVWLITQDNSNQYTNYWDLATYSYVKGNSLPVINSNSTDPDVGDWVLNQPVNISEVNATDPDGNIAGVNYSVSNGSNTFINQERLTNISKAPELFQKNRSFTPTDTDTWYNITVTAFDTDGDTNTSSMKQYIPPNQAPNIQRFVKTPGTVLHHDKVSYNSTVTDPDGSVNNVTLVVEEGGTVIVDNQTTTGTPNDYYSFTDVVNATNENQFYNATLYAEDNDGALSTATVNFYILDAAPNVTIFEPGDGVTRFNYTTPVSYNVTNRDDVPNEEMNCYADNESVIVTSDDNIIEDLGVVETFENSTLYQQPLGTNIPLRVSCIEQNGLTLTGGAQHNFDVDDFAFSSQSSTGTTVETRNTSYNYTVEAGSMVNQLNHSLTHNGDTINRNVSFSGPANVSRTQWFRPRLVSTNNTAVDYGFDYAYNRTEISGGYTTQFVDPGNNSQTLYQGFFFVNSSITSPVVEGGEYNHTFWMRSVTDVPSVSPRHIFWRDTSTHFPVEADTPGYKRFNTSVFVDKISSAQETYDASTDVLVSFDGDMRTLRQSSNDTVTVDRFVVAPCSSNAANTTAVNFTSYDENDRDDLTTTTFDTAFAYWKDPSFKKVVNTSSTGTSHTFCLEPDYAELKAQGTRQQSIVSGTDKATRSFYLLKQNLDNDTTNIPLYMLNSSDATQITFDVEDSDGNPRPGTVLSFERYFPSDNANIRVGMAKTSSDGSTQAKLAVGEEQTYQIKAYNLSSSLLDIFESEVFTQSPVTLQLGADGIINYIDRISATSFSCVQDTASINCSYSTTASLDTITLNVQAFQTINTSTVCDISSTSSSGVLVCQGLNTTDNRYSYTLDALFSDGSEIRLDTGSFGNRNLLDFGVAGVFVTALVVMALALAGAFSPTVSIFLTGIGVIVGYVTGMLSIGITAVTSFLLVGAFLIYRMNQT